MKKSEKAYIILLVVLLPMIIIAVFWFIYLKNGSRTEMEPNTGSIRSNRGIIITGCKIGELLDSTQKDSGDFAISDSDGNVYFTTTTDGVDYIFVRTPSGDTIKRWSYKNKKSKPFDIAGKDDSGIFVFWSQTREKNPKNIWNENFEYRRLGFGTKNYSGMSTTTLKKKILKQLRERENATP